MKTFLSLPPLRYVLPPISACKAHDRYSYRKLEDELNAQGLTLPQIEHPQGGRRRAKPTEEQVEDARSVGKPRPDGLWLPVSQATAMTVSAVGAPARILSSDVARCRPSRYRTLPDGSRVTIEAKDHPVAHLPMATANLGVAWAHPAHAIPSALPGHKGWNLVFPNQQILLALAFECILILHTYSRTASCALGLLTTDANSVRNQTAYTSTGSVGENRGFVQTGG